MACMPLKNSSFAIKLDMVMVEHIPNITVNEQEIDLYSILIIFEMMLNTTFIMEIC
jgi:hypothetical protein